MKFALFSHIAWPEGTNQRQIIEQTTEEVQHGESLGFHSAWFAEHHFSRYGIGSSSLMIAGAIAVQTKTIRLGTAVLVPPLHNPIRLAEDTATVDLISNGRLDVGFGRGSAAYEYTGYDIDQSASQGMFRESINTIQALWTTPDYSHDGRHYSVNHVTLVPSPVQRPHPPIYIAATRTQATLEFVVSTGHPLIIGVVLNTADALDLCRLFVTMSKESGHNVPMSDIPFFRYFYVAETEEQARIDAKVALDWNLDMIGWRRTFTEGSEVDLNLADWRGAVNYTPPDFEHLYNQRVVMGTPGQVVAQIKDLQAQGIEYFGCNFAFGGMPHDKIMRSMELFSKEVMPHFS